MMIRAARSEDGQTAAADPSDRPESGGASPGRASSGAGIMATGLTGLAASAGSAYDEPGRADGVPGRATGEPGPADAHGPPGGRRRAARSGQGSIPSDPGQHVLDRTERVLIGAASLALGLGGLAALWLLARPLALLLAAIVVANALEPLVARLGRWMPRAVAVAALYLMMLGALGLLGWLVIPDLVAQGRELLARGPELIEQGRQLLERSVPAQAGGASVQSTISEQAGQAITVPFTVASGLLDLVLVLALAAYWLVDLPRLRRFALSLVPAARAAEASDVLREIGQSMGGYVRGTAINAAIVGTAVTIGMLVIGLPYPVLFGLLAALGEPFPYVGPLAAAIPAVLVALVQSPTQALIVLAFYLVVQLVEGYLLFPLVVGEQADVSPILVIVALLAGGALGGLLGALVAVPAVAALQVIVRRLLVPALRRRIGGSEGVAERTDVAMHPAEAGERG